MNESVDTDGLDFEIILTHCADGMVVTNREGCILYVNHVAASLLGAQRDELIGTTFPGPLQPGETRDVDMPGGKGSLLVAEMRTADVTVEGETLHLLSLRDVTRRREREDDLVASSNEAGPYHDENRDLRPELMQRLERELSRSVSMVTAGMGREIGTPFAYIASNLGVLKQYAQRLTQFTELQDEFITTIDTSVPLDELSEQRRSLKIDHILKDMPSLLSESIEGAEKITDIIRALDSFSQQEGGEYRLGDINGALEDAIVAVSYDMGWTPMVSKEFGHVPPLLCDVERIKQACMNILVNAVEAAGEAGEIRLKTCSSEDHLYIAVTDTGPGIEAGILERIFDPFFTTKEGDRATGLGLTVARRVVERHRGEITITSTPGSGTTCTIRMPFH